jgi:DNA mismatch repair protein MutS
MADYFVFPEVRLLWPEGFGPSTDGIQKPTWGEYAVADLGIHTLVDALSPQTHLKDRFRSIFLQASPHPQVIHYRQEVLEDVLRSPALLQGLEGVLPRLSQLAFLSDYPYSTLLEQIVSRLGALELWVECVKELAELLAAPETGVRAAALLRLRAALESQAADPSFQSLAEQLPDLRQRASGVSSITVGVNLDAQLRPVAAALLSFNDQPVRGGRETLIGRLLGSGPDKGEPDGFEGIAPLHSVPKDIPGLARSTSQPPDPLMFPLFKDLDRVLKRTMEPVARVLQQYLHLHGRALAVLEPEIAFYLSGAQLIRRMEAAGVPFCRAEIAPIEDRVCQLHDFYNINLALRLSAGEADLSQVLVANDVEFGDAARIFILTGLTRVEKPPLPRRSAWRRCCSRPGCTCRLARHASARWTRSSRISRLKRSRRSMKAAWVKRRSAWRPSSARPPATAWCC